MRSQINPKKHRQQLESPLSKSFILHLPLSSLPTTFPSTRWTLLRQVRTGTAAEARAALETLCKAYWQPLYYVARQRQLTDHDAKDAVQGFFECMLRRETFSAADETMGKLRQLLLHAFDKFCTQQWQKANRQKRGGGVEHVELSAFFDPKMAEERYLRSSSHNLSLEKLYNQEWAETVLEHSLQALRKDYDQRGWLGRYDLLVRTLLQHDEEVSLVEIAATTSLTAGALRVYLHRMRSHYREHIEREIARTLDTNDPALIQEELLDLFKAFA